MKKFLIQLLPVVTLIFAAVMTAQEQAIGPTTGITNGPTQSCVDAWAATSTNNAPLPEQKHTAVWTGSEMIVWGGQTDFGALNLGGRYNPSTDSWTTTSTTNAPAGRYNHTAVWTGTEMIVWGGYDGSVTDFNTGGRYNPNTNSWTATSTTNAPTGRSLHTAIWTGTEMIVWGGFSGNTALNSGGRYDPTTNTWSALTTNNAPAGRAYYTAIWTGAEMIVWGGYNGTISFGDGGKYNPGTNTWAPTNPTNAPTPRSNHTAIWTGSEMTLWGGFGNSDLNTGGKYNPNTNTWTSTSVLNAPAGTSFASGIWTGSEMIVWGGNNAGIYRNTGGRYTPASDTWTATSTNNAPAGRAFHTGVWTGNQMIVWGGFTQGVTNTGGRYCAPSSTSPTPTPTPPNTPTPTPTPTATPTATPTPSPTPTPPHTPTPTPTPSIPPTPSPTPTPFGNTCGWSSAPAYPVEVYDAGFTSLGGYIYGFGGTNSIPLQDAYKFDGVSWTPIALLPAAQSAPSAMNDGTNIYVVDSGVFKYDPVANAYTPLAQFHVATMQHSAVYLGGKIYKMCGIAPGGGSPTGSNTLEIYDIATNTWTLGANCPYAATHVTAFTFGNYVYVAGGLALPPSSVNRAVRYDPSTNTWDDSIADLPMSRFSSTAAAYGNGVVLAAGGDIFQTLNSAIFWDSASNQWLNLPDMLAARPGGKGAVLNGSFYVVGGNSDSSSTGTTTNQKLSCTSLPTPTPTPHTPTPTPTPTPTATPTPTPTPTPTASPSATPAAQTTFGNISTRLRVETGNNVLIGGFIVTGTQSKRVIVRAIGPSLPFPGILTDPFLELRDSSGALIRANDNWRDEQEAEIIATTIPPSNDLESAVVATLPANGAAYTATVRGLDNGTGIGVVEVYDLNRAVNSKLANISTRGLVQTGDNVLIGGLIVLGQNPLRVILRAIGPSLPVQDALADPMLELRDGNGGLVASNDNWRSDQEAEIIATTIPPSNDFESAIVRNLAPGNYTAIVSGVANTTGVGLVEAYNLSN